MKSIRCAHVVVVADSASGLAFAARLRGIEIAEVRTVGGLDTARQLCRAGAVDACLVTCDEAIADAPPRSEVKAPGSGCGVPSLMVVQVVTPYLRNKARRAGYAAAVPAAIPARMLYRRLGALLQNRRATRRSRRIRGIDVPYMALSGVACSKPTLH